MKTPACLLLLVIAFASCSSPTTDTAAKETKPAIEGTWQLLTGTLIENGKATVTSYTHDTSFIKIITGFRFAFFGHDLQKGKDSASAYYAAGSGKYDMADSTYTEHLEYCTDRQWEGTDFHFTYSISSDTLTITGEEKLESEHIDRLNVEKYIRLAK